MKYIIASDIHGSYKYAKKLCNFVDKEDPLNIILLGDILYHGARNPLPEEYDTIKTYELLNEYKDKIIAVRGNCDSEVDELVTNFSLISDLKQLSFDGINYYITHGHLNDKYSILFNNSRIISGHTHVYKLSKNDINPGSVGIPKVNKEHTCILYVNKMFKIINLDDYSIIEEMKNEIDNS